jgi:hypothetical protein
VADLNEVVAEAAEQVASEALNVAAASRSLSGRDLAIGLVVGAAIGAGISFLWTRRKLETKYEKIAEEEIDAMREHFRSRLVAKEDKPDLEDLAGKAQELGYASPTGPKPSPEADPTALEPRPPVPLPPRPKPNRIHQALEEAQNDQTVGDDGWNYDAEKAQRQHDTPYVIHFDERGEADFDQVTFTYYEGDDVVCDNDDQIVQPRDQIVGDQNLDKFGHGSGDPNVVYLRNDNLAVEIELTRDPGSYSEEVRGIKHWDGGVEPRPRRPREEQ